MPTRKATPAPASASSIQSRNGGTYALLAGEKSLNELTLPTSVQNLFIVPAVADLIGADLEFGQYDRREFLLRAALHDGNSAASTVFIDCPPGLGLLTLNALVAAGRRAGAAAMRVLRP